MQHIETDQFAQSRVSIVVSLARAATVFYSLCAVVQITPYFISIISFPVYIVS